MSSNARPQFKLPLSNRTIVQAGDFYYFGGFPARRDMTPAGFDRSFGVANVNERSPFSIQGSNAMVLRASSNRETFRAPGRQSFSNLQDRREFESTLGVTAGQKFTSYYGRIYQVTDSGELVDRFAAVETSVVNPVSPTTFDQVAFAYIVGETPEYLYVLSQMAENYNSTVTQMQYANRFTRVNKMTGVVAAVIGHPSGSFGMPSTWTETSTVTTETGASPDLGVATFRNVQYLYTMADGRQVYSFYSTCVYGTTLSGVSYGSTLRFSPTANNVRYAVLDLANNRIDCGPAIIVPGAANVFGNTPSGLLSRKTDTTEGVMFIPHASSSSGPIIVSVVDAPSVFPANGTSASSVPLNTDRSYYNRRVCVVKGLPEGLTLNGPVASTMSVRGQLSSWVFQDNGKDYLCVFPQSSARWMEEGDQSLPAAAHILYTFEVDKEDPSQLTYVSHQENAFGYGLPLTDILMTADRRIAVVSNSTGFGMLSWVSALGRYNVSEFRSVPGGLSRISLDETAQVWAEGVDGSVYVYNVDLSASVNFTFEGNPTALRYVGETLEQYGLLQALNFLGEPVARSVRVQLKGATFDDGSTSRIIQTSAEEPTRVLLMVNGTSNVSVDAYLV